MKNKKTTIAGILLIVGAVCTGAAQMMTGTAEANDVFAAILAALGGSGLIVAGDGGL